MIKSLSSTQGHSSIVRRKGFSLVEILVVIGIIAVLAAASFPVAGSIQRNSKLKKNKALVTALSNAIDRFHAEYGYLPAQSQPAPSDDTELSGEELVDLLKELEGKDDNLIFNTKGINFLEAVTAAKNKKNGIVRESGDITGCFNAMGEDVFIKLDYNYDEEVTAPSEIEGKDIPGVKALVWTYGHNDDASEEQILDDSAASWR